MAGKKVHKVMNQVILPVVGMGGELDRMMGLVGSVLSMVMVALVIEVVGLVGELSEKTVKKEVLRSVQKIDFMGMSSLARGKHVRYK